MPRAEHEPGEFALVDGASADDSSTEATPSRQYVNAGRAPERARRAGSPDVVAVRGHAGYGRAIAHGLPVDDRGASGVDVEPIAFFVLQFLWFLLSWSLIARLVLWPWSAALSPDARLSAWIAPEMFRVLGVGLLVPNLAPGMPASFALPTAIADSLTALLAAVAFVGLRRRWAAARGIAWACTLVGSIDLLVAFPHAASVGAISHLATQWYVPVFAGSFLVVCHVACFVLLLRGRAGSGP